MKVTSNGSYLTRQLPHMVVTSHDSYLTWQLPQIAVTSHDSYLTWQLHHMDSYLTWQLPHMAVTSHGSYLTWQLPHMAVASHDSYLTWQLPHTTVTSHDSYLTWQLPRMTVTSNAWHVQVAYLTNSFSWLVTPTPPITTRERIYVRKTWRDIPTKIFQQKYSSPLSCEKFYNAGGSFLSVQSVYNTRVIFEHNILSEWYMIIDQYGTA